jgi:TonB family protein
MIKRILLTVIFLSFFGSQTAFCQAALENLPNKVNEEKDLSKVNTSHYDTAFKMSEVDQIPQFLKYITYQYTFLAKRNNIQGRVVIRFIIDTEGNVLDPQVTESEPEGVFDKIALDAISKCRFKPAIKGGKPVDCIVNLPIKFRIR